jgi:hypothetical protein
MLGQLFLPLACSLADAEEGTGEPVWRFGFKLLNSVICSSIDSLILALLPPFERHALQRVSAQFWHILQSGQGCLPSKVCFESDCIMAPVMLV